MVTHWNADARRADRDGGRGGEQSASSEAEETARNASRQLRSAVWRLERSWPLTTAIILVVLVVALALDPG